MTMLRSSSRFLLTLSLAAPVVVLAAPTLVAQYGQQYPQYPQSSQSAQPLFTWSGRVDRETQITMRGRDVYTRSDISGRDGRGRSRVESMLPQTDGYVTASLLSGRGSVQVVQQPSSSNDYTTILLVRDPSGGAADYQVAAYWRSTGRSGYGRGNGNGNGGYGRGNGNGNGGYGNGRGRGNVGNDRGNGNDRGDDEGIRRRDRRDDRDRGDDRDRDDDRDRRGDRGQNGGYGNGGYGNGGNGGYGGYGNGLNTAMSWSGNVDAGAEIRVQGRRVDTRSLGGNGTQNVRWSIGTGLPQQDIQQLVVTPRQGRGSIVVVQQPSSYNNYTAIVRISDPQSGFGFYDFDLAWR